MANGDRKTLGEIDGRWAIMLKAHLVIVPIVLTLATAWATWVTRELFLNQAFRTSGERYTSAERALLQTHTSSIEFLAKRFDQQDAQRAATAQQTFERLDKLGEKLSDIQRQVDQALKER